MTRNLEITLNIIRGLVKLDININIRVRLIGLITGDGTYPGIKNLSAQERIELFSKQEYKDFIQRFEGLSPELFRTLMIDDVARDYFLYAGPLAIGVFLKHLAQCDPEKIKKYLINTQLMSIVDCSDANREQLLDIFLNLPQHQQKQILNYFNPDLRPMPVQNMIRFLAPVPQLAQRFLDYLNVFSKKEPLLPLIYNTNYPKPKFTYIALDIWSLLIEAARLLRNPQANIKNLLKLILGIEKKYDEPETWLSGRFSRLYGRELHTETKLELDFLKQVARYQPVEALIFILTDTRITLNSKTTAPLFQSRILELISYIKALENGEKKIRLMSLATNMGSSLGQVIMYQNNIFSKGKKYLPTLLDSEPNILVVTRLMQELYLEGYREEDFRKPSNHCNLLKNKIDFIRYFFITNARSSHPELIIRVLADKRITFGPKILHAEIIAMYASQVSALVAWIKQHPLTRKQKQDLLEQCLDMSSNLGKVVLQRRGYLFSHDYMYELTCELNKLLPPVSAGLQGLGAASPAALSQDSHQTGEQDSIADPLAPCAIEIGMEEGVVCSEGENEFGKSLSRYTG